MNTFINFGLAGLFLASFLAATLLPLGSELVLAGMLSLDWNPWLLVVIATIGNVLGSCTNYAIGRWGEHYILPRLTVITCEQKNAAQIRFQRWGAPSLLFAWVPIIGDPLTVIAGMAKIHLGVFITLVTLGKAARYAALAYTVSVNFAT